MELSYEPATPADINPIFDLCKQLIRRYEDPNSIDPDLVLPWIHRKITAHIASYTRILYQGKIVGYYHLAPNGEEMELDDLYVFPKFQGMGIGSAVLRRCCATNQPMMLYVFTENHGAITLYRRFGFTEAETVSATRIIMRRPTDAAQEVL